MKLSISNIAWTSKDDLYMYNKLNSLGYNGLEIAPTRIFPENPYEHINDAFEFKNTLLENYNLRVSSMQSIWYGISEGVFESDSSRKFLINYTKKAIDFAESLSCGNLVFGCPKNRNIQNSDQYPIGVEFFKELGDYAFKHNTVLSIEANPPIYGTNYINTTAESFELVKNVNSKGFLVNLDFGTIIYNKENLDNIDFDLVNHIHISEPNLVKIEQRQIHKKLFKDLNTIGYKKYISIELKTQEDIKDIEGTLQYIRELNDEY